jgi:Berberine and berberine like
MADGRKAAERISRCMSLLRALEPNGGAYVSESNYFVKQWRQSYWGSNYARLAAIKRKYDPDGLFFVHNGVGSGQWSADGFKEL